MVVRVVVMGPRRALQDFPWVIRGISLPCLAGPSWLYGAWVIGVTTCLPSASPVAECSNPKAAHTAVLVRLTVASGVLQVLPFREVLPLRGRFRILVEGAWQIYSSSCRVASPSGTCTSSMNTPTRIKR